MAGTLDHLIRLAAAHPVGPREALYRELLGSTTYLLHVAEPGSETVKAEPGDTLSIWADQDAQSGALWVPVFTSPERVSEFISVRDLAAPEGREFYWMAHEPGEVWGVLRDVRCLAGVRLDPTDRDGIGIEYPEVIALCDGRVPSEGPFLYEFPVEEFRIPDGTKVAVAPMRAEVTGMSGSQVLFKDGGPIKSEDFRKMVCLRLGEARDDVAWTPCRHFTGVLRKWLKKDPSTWGILVDVLLRSEMAFEMYGEAEALCEWLQAQETNEAYAWVYLSAIYGRTGRLQSCAELCEKGIWKYSKERAFYLNQARAFAQLDDRAAAQEAARRGLALFPEDRALSRFIGQGRSS